MESPWQPLGGRLLFPLGRLLLLVAAEVVASRGMLMALSGARVARVAVAQVPTDHLVSTALAPPARPTLAAAVVAQTLGARSAALVVAAWLSSDGREAPRNRRSGNSTKWWLSAANAREAAPVTASVTPQL